MAEARGSSERAGADVLLRGGTVLTMDVERRIWAPGSVAIRGHDIVAVGPAKEIEAAFRANSVVNCQGHVIMPGLVNTHTHMPMSLLRGLADDLRLDVWLYGYILPVEREFVNPEFCFLGTLLSTAEMLRGGTTCFADMYYHEEEVAWAAVQAGIRGVCGETVMKLPTPDASSFEEGLRNCRDFLEHWRGHDLIVAAPAPHSVYASMPEILSQSTALARQYDVPMLMHVSETREEVETWVASTTLRPVRWLEEQGVLEAKMVAAHCVHVNGEEIQILGRCGVGVAHNPTSNLKLASGIAPVTEMLRSGLSVGIGTDGCASNNDLDMFEEMRLAALLAKVATGEPVSVSAREAVAMATINGARVLHLDHLIGSLEPGKRADLIVVRSEGAHSLPHYETTGGNIYARLVYAAKSNDVRDVYVNGREVVRDGHVLTVDEERVFEQAAEQAGRINRFITARHASILTKLVDIGGLHQRETYEVQAKGIVQDVAVFELGLGSSSIHVTGHTSRDQYDTYLIFDDPAQGRLRYREDNVIEPDGAVEPIYSLTLMGPAKEAEYPDSVVLSRSIYTAQADKSLRFYREYFQPSEERAIVKRRERYHIRYRGLDFAVNFDDVREPPQSTRFVEIKSRTWSARDAVRKAEMISELLRVFGAEPSDLFQQEYVELFDEAWHDG